MQRTHARVPSQDFKGARARHVTEHVGVTRHNLTRDVFNLVVRHAEKYQVGRIPHTHVAVREELHVMSDAAEGLRK
jgi:hypothetical protein